MLLGKKIPYPDKYNADILYPIRREENRSAYAISNSIFTGFDSWHAWEFSFITDQGLPVSGILKIVYPSESEYIIESKSLKLYLNSFNMTRFGSNKKNGLSIVLNTIKSDLSKKLNTDVNVNYFDHITSGNYDFNDYINIENTIDLENINFNIYNEHTEYLSSEDNTPTSFKIYSDLLRSNCKVTNQPDFGSVFIYYKGNKRISYKSILKYIVSLRNENHFHEEICELIYKRFDDLLVPDELMVSCIYTRRGGIDICPSRASHSVLLPSNLVNPKVISQKLYRQ